MGLSTDSKNTGMAGSKFWCAPEMIKKLKYDNKVDVWSLGALTYEVNSIYNPDSHLKLVGRKETAI